MLTVLPIAGFHITGPLWMALIITLLFALLARGVRGVSTSGAIAGGAVCFVLYAAAGLRAFGALVLVFIVTWAATRFGYQRKQKLGTAEKKSGRTAAQVLANVGLAAAFAAAYSYTSNLAFLLAMSAVLAEAAADTVSSELGQAFDQTARLVTTWEKVPAGTDGGVTFTGTFAGIVSAILISIELALTGLLPWKWLMVSAGAAVIAMFADSFLGAVLERRGVLNNNAVNFLSTLFAGVVSFFLVSY